MWLGVGSLIGLADDGSSWFAICIVLFTSFAGVGVSALIAPLHKLNVALLTALVTVFLVPYPYTSETSGDGEAIPSSHQLVGVILGIFLAIALIFFLSRRAQESRSS